MSIIAYTPHVTGCELRITRIRSIVRATQTDVKSQADRECELTVQTASPLPLPFPLPLPPTSQLQLQVQVRSLSLTHPVPATSSHPASRRATLSGNSSKPPPTPRPPPPDRCEAMLQICQSANSAARSTGTIMTIAIRLRSARALRTWYHHWP